MLRRRSIRLRILALVLVPLLALIALYGLVLDLTLSSYLHLNQAAGLRSAVSGPVSGLQLQLAAERRLAVDYMASRQIGDHYLFVQQEAETDRSVSAVLGALSGAAVRAAAGPQERVAISTLVIDLKGLAGLRSEVANSGRNREDVLASYSTLIDDGSNVLDQAILPLVSGPLGIQANGLVNMSRAGFAVTEEGDLIEADLIGRSFPPSDQQAFSQLSVLRLQLVSETMPILSPGYQHNFAALVPLPASDELRQLEKVIASRHSAGPLPVSLAAWKSAITAYSDGFERAVRQSAAALDATATTQARGIVIQLVGAGLLGLLAIVLTLVVSFRVGQGLIRQLNELRQAAVELSGTRLPAAIGRLRAGEEI